MQFDELISTGEFAEQIPHNYQKLRVGKNE
jgi:hypothetical protein